LQIETSHAEDRREAGGTPVATQITMENATPASTAIHPAEAHWQAAAPGAIARRPCEDHTECAAGSDNPISPSKSRMMRVSREHGAHRKLAHRVNARASKGWRHWRSNQQNEGDRSKRTMIVRRTLPTTYRLRSRKSVRRAAVHQENRVASRGERVHFRLRHATLTPVFNRPMML
jgi:hypothetical protein